MKNLIQRWLGIDLILAHLQDIDKVPKKLDQLSDQLGAYSLGVGRIIAKIDPKYGLSEFDPDRIAESKALEEQIMARLLGEHKAQQHHKGK
jgi:hypothetical protein